MKYLLPRLVLVLLSLALPAIAETQPGYCVQLLPHAGYTIIEKVVVTDEGFISVGSADGELSLGQATAYQTDAEVFRLVQLRAKETYLARKEGRVYLIGQIDMQTPEPYCARQPLG